MSLKIDPWSFPDAEHDPKTGGERAAIVLGGGCFWCTEAVYKELKGVIAVTSGYAGDGADKAHYDAVKTGRTNHAEVIKVEYDPSVIGLGQILKIFFSIAHDPTQVDGQGNDIGRQYRSVIFYADDHQKEVAERYMAQIEKAGIFSKSLATELEPLEAFYEAEDYHLDFAAKNPTHGYVRFAAAPKVEKLKTSYKDMLKS